MRSGRPSGYAAATCRWFRAIAAIIWRWRPRCSGGRAQSNTTSRASSRDYPRIREGQGVLDDWATPLDAYVRAAAFRIAGLGPQSSVEARLVAAKACSFITNLLALPALYILARRCYNPRVALWSMAALAILPVHAIYAGFVLAREPGGIGVDPGGLDALRGLPRRAQRAGHLGVGCRGGSMRRTGRPLTHDGARAAGGRRSIRPGHARSRRLGLSCLWAAIAGLVCVPWAWMTLQEYGFDHFIRIQAFSNITSPGRSIITTRATRFRRSFTRWQTCRRSCGSRSSRCS